MKSSGVLATLMLAAVAGYASAVGTCSDKNGDTTADDAVTNGECAAAAPAGQVGTASTGVETATCALTACDMATTADYTACCTNTPCGSTEFKAAGDSACATRALVGTCTDGVWADGSITADSTCVTWTHPAATDCGDGKLHGAGTVSADSTCVVCDAGKAGTAGVCDVTCDGTTEFSLSGAVTCTSLTACTTGVLGAGSATADNTCVTWTHPAATDCGDGKLHGAGTSSADSTCVNCDAGKAGTAGVCDVTCDGTTKYSAAGAVTCTLWTTADAATCNHATTGTDSGDADGTTYTWAAGSATADATCTAPPTTCDASALISTTPAATGAGDCTATLDDTTSCTQVMAGGTCTASSCAGTTLTPGTCSVGALCSSLSAGACTGTAVKDAGTKTCAADPCVDGTDFTDKDSNCCKAKPPAPATTTSGAATAAVSLTALLALVLA